MQISPPPFSLPLNLPNVLMHSRRTYHPPPLPKTSFIFPLNMTHERSRSHSSFLANPYGSFPCICIQCHIYKDSPSNKLLFFTPIQFAPANFPPFLCLLAHRGPDHFTPLYLKTTHYLRCHPVVPLHALNFLTQFFFFVFWVFFSHNLSLPGSTVIDK